jgi:hypothetical protein
MTVHVTERMSMHASYTNSVYHRIASQVANSEQLLQEVGTGNVSDPIHCACKMYMYKAVHMSKHACNKLILQSLYTHSSCT